jgi:hypothetical protein
MPPRRRSGKRPKPIRPFFPWPPSDTMPAEFDLYGVYVPRLLVLMLLAFGLVIVIRRILARLGAYSLVWHRGLSDLALYVLLLGAVSSLTRWYFA